MRAPAASRNAPGPTTSPKTNSAEPIAPKTGANDGPGGVQPGRRHWHELPAALPRPEDRKCPERHRDPQQDRGEHEQRQQRDQRAPIRDDELRQGVEDPGPELLDLFHRWAVGGSGGPLHVVRRADDESVGGDAARDGQESDAWSCRPRRGSP